MKKMFIGLALLIASIGAKAQTKSGTYFQLGSTIDNSKWTQQAQIGGYVGKHQIGLIVETYEHKCLLYTERNWYGGLAYQFSQPLDQTVEIQLSGAGKLKLTEGESNIILEPGIGFGFNFSREVQLQTGVSTQFDENFVGSKQPQLDLGLNFKF